ncbi:hypothetical protein TNCV_3802801 [Trichonephila clavipes]|nr:hypothetical protein TNCV_3802801 [Trichonephila clavipes]
MEFKWSFLILFTVVKATDSWLAYHEFEHCTAEDPPCRADAAKYVEAEMSSRWCGEEVRRENVPAQVSFSSLDHGSNERGSSPKALV